ncbi:hypothetical protein YWY31_06980 [Paenibacillus illinoisensis]
MQTQMNRTVRGSLLSERKPYIQYEGVKYRSEKLANSAHLIKQELVLHVNVDDLRTLKAYHPNGSEFGYLTACGRWSLYSTFLANETCDQFISSAKANPLYNLGRSYLRVH